MKKLLVAVFTVLMTVAPVQKSEAAVAGVMALTGAGAAGSVAIAGLASPLVVGGTLAIANSHDDMGVTLGFAIGAYMGGIVGLVLLDEETGEVNFNELDLETAKKLALTSAEIATYNAEIEEANILVEEVIANLDGESSLEESRAVWNDMKDFVSPETFKVMQTLVSQK